MRLGEGNGEKNNKKEEKRGRKESYAQIQKLQSCIYFQCLGKGMTKILAKVIRLRWESECGREKLITKINYCQY